MKTYFGDWEISDSKGVVLRWANTITESNYTPSDVFSSVKKELVKEHGNDLHVRAKAFNSL